MAVISGPALAASALEGAAATAVRPLEGGALATAPAMPDIFVIDEPIGPVTVALPNYTIDLVDLGPPRDRAAATAVPEPATWAMMMLGFGALGYLMRRRRLVMPGVSAA